VKPHGFPISQGFRHGRIQRPDALAHWATNDTRWLGWDKSQPGTATTTPEQAVMARRAPARDSGLGMGMASAHRRPSPRRFPYLPPVPGPPPSLLV
jgi:hypothetical protein